MTTRSEIENTLSLIRGWASDRNLLDGSTPGKQMKKLLEEVGELAEAIDGINEANARIEELRAAKKNGKEVLYQFKQRELWLEKFKDAIGDCSVDLLS